MKLIQAIRRISKATTLKRKTCWILPPAFFPFSNSEYNLDSVYGKRNGAVEQSEQFFLIRLISLLFAWSAIADDLNVTTVRVPPLFQFCVHGFSFTKSSKGIT